MATNGLRFVDYFWFVERDLKFTGPSKFRENHQEFEEALESSQSLNHFLVPRKKNKLYLKDSDFGGTLGFDNLCKRIREGQKCCKDVEEFFRKKSKAQQQYSKALRSLARSADGKEEIGDLGKSWSEVKEQTEITARLYEYSATEYIKLADELAKFHDSSKTVTKQIEDRVKDKQKIKKILYNKTLDLKGSYVEKCRDMMQSESQYETARQNVTVNLKDVDKLKVKYDKSRDAMEKADTLYKQSIEALEHARVIWESEMAEACEVFQQNEEDRIYTLRDDLWKCSNIDSKLCVDWDQTCESIRNHLERCDVETDLDNFIHNFMTGNKRPPPVTYENYFSDKPSSHGPPSKSARNQPLPPLPVSNHSTGDYAYTEIASLTKRW